MAVRQTWSTSSPKAHGSWLAEPLIVWLRTKGKKTPMAVQWASSSALALSQKPPMSGPLKGCPESPRVSVMGMLSHIWSHDERLSPVHVAA